MNRLSIGHFWCGSSKIHSLDPRAKAVALFVIMFTSFTIVNIYQMLLSFVFALALLKMTHVPQKVIYNSLKPVFIFILVIGLFNMFVVRGGDVVLTLGFIKITDRGIRAAILYSYRFMAMILFAATLLLTTSSSDLTRAFEAILSPLKRLGVPISEIALTLSLALRFIPTLAFEAQLIMQAQQSRGASFETGGVASRLKALTANIMPLFASTMRHVDSLSKALDARCWNCGFERSSWEPMKIKTDDIVFIVIAIMYTICLVFLKRYSI